MHAMKKTILFPLLPFPTTLQVKLQDAVFSALCLFSFSFKQEQAAMTTGTLCFCQTGAHYVSNEQKGVRSALWLKYASWKDYVT